MKRNRMDELAYFRAQEEVKRRDAKLQNLKSRLDSMAAELEDLPEQKYTGWYMLLKKDDAEPAGVKFLGFFNPEISAEGDEPEWDLCIPLPEAGSFPEFDGW